ncbi:MAG: hypothetical protein AABY22_05015 [Nanoarchaeota archaeon]
MSNSSQKGKALEDFVAQRLIDLGIDPNAYRQHGSGNGKKKGDVQNNSGWTFECKNSKNFNWRKTTDQVQREAMGYNKEVIIWHPPQKALGESIAVIAAEDFFTLLKFFVDHKDRVEILDKYSIKNNLEKAIFHLKQVTKEL